jgi:hypothetical protein
MKKIKNVRLKARKPMQLRWGKPDKNQEGKLNSSEVIPKKIGLPLRRSPVKLVASFDLTWPTYFPRRPPCWKLFYVILILTIVAKITHFCATSATSSPRECRLRTAKTLSSTFLQAKKSLDSGA